MTKIAKMIPQPINMFFQKRKRDLRKNKKMVTKVHLDKMTGAI